MENLFGILPKLLNEFESSEEVREAVVFSTWKKTAGKSLCQHAIPLNLKDTRLTLAVKSEMWKSHLESLAGQIIFKINSALNKTFVTFIDFRVDEVQFEEPQKNDDEQEISSQTALDEISEKLEASTKNINDEKLRKQFLLAAGNCLVRKKNLQKTTKFRD